jgi:hypothetical protein
MSQTLHKTDVARCFCSTGRSLILAPLFNLLFLKHIKGFWPESVLEQDIIFIFIFISNLLGILYVSNLYSFNIFLYKSIYNIKYFYIFLYIFILNKRGRISLIGKITFCGNAVQSSSL